MTEPTAKNKNTFFGNLNYLKIIFTTLLTIILFIVAIFVIIIPQFENIILDRKREMIRELTASTISILQSWNEKQKSGALSETDAQRGAAEQIRILRYGEAGKDYFWITDLAPVMIMHPYRPELNGTSLADFEDSRKKKLFVEMARVVKKSGEGYVDYMWQWKDDSTRIVPKLSYVRLFTPWGWVVGTGIYIEDVRLEIKKLESSTLTISIIITIISSLLLLYIGYHTMKTEKGRREAEENLRESREKYKTLVEASGEGLILALDNEEIFFNKTFYKIFGYPESAPLIDLKKIFVQLPESDLFDFVAMKRKNDKPEAIEHFETTCKKQNGEFLNVFLMLSPITVAGNSGIVINIKDMSVAETSGDLSDTSGHLFSTLASRISSGVFRTIPDKRMILTGGNPAFTLLTGWKSDETVAENSILDFITNNQDRGDFVEELFSKGILLNRILQFKKTDGASYIARVSAVVVKNNRLKSVAVEGIIEDVSEQYRVRTEQEKLIADLQNSVSVFGQRITPFIEPLHSCRFDQTVADAIMIMTGHQSSHVLVRGEKQEALGVVADKDIRVRLLNEKKELSQPAYSIMTSPVHKIPGNATLLDAMHLFKKHGTDALVVAEEDDNPSGIITGKVIFEASWGDVLFFLRHIEQAASAEAIKQSYEEVLRLVRSLIESNGDLYGINKLTSLLSDTITRRLLNLAEAELGRPPVSYAFITMGSEGREEQSLVTDQDNAIIFKDSSPEEMPGIQEYFLRLGKRVSEGLNAIGYQYCKGGIMAGNIKWCKSFSQWKQQFTHWISDANPQDLLELKISFDFRAVSGEADFENQLRGHITRLLSGNNAFFVYLSESVASFELPESMAKLKGPIDSKLLLLPVVDFARLYSLKHSLPELNTIRRIELLYKKGLLARPLYLNLIYAYDAITRMRLKHQAAGYAAGQKPDNIFALSEISDIQQVVIKKYIELIREIKDKLSLDFRGVPSK